jgi:hypothetical protein
MSRDRMKWNLSIRLYCSAAMRDDLWLLGVGRKARMSPTWARGFPKATTGATKFDFSEIKAIHVFFAWNTSFTARLILLSAGSTIWWRPAAVHFEACLTRCATCRPLSDSSLPPVMNYPCQQWKTANRKLLIFFFIT